MKFFLWGVLGAAMGCGMAGNTRASLDIFLYHHRPSQFQEQRFFPVQRGQWKLLIENLPKDVDESSFLIKSLSPTVVLRSYELVQSHSKNLTYETLLRECMGKKNQTFLVGVQEKIFEPVQILGIQGNKTPIILRKNFIDFQPEGRLVFKPFFPFNPLPSLKLFGISLLSQSAHFSISYLCPTLFWKANYLVEIEENKIFFVGILNFQNLTGMPLKARLQWISSMNASPQLLAEQMEIPEKLPVNVQFLRKKLEGKERFHFFLPEKLLPQGEKLSLRCHLWVSEKDLNLEHIPHGEMTLYRLSDKNFPLYVRKESLKKENQTQLDLFLKEKKEVFLEVEQHQKRHLDRNKEEHTYYLKMTNQTSQDITYTLHCPLNGKTDFLRSYAVPQEVSSQEIQWTMTLPGKSSQVFWYRILVLSP